MIFYSDDLKFNYLMFFLNIIISLFIFIYYYRKFIGLDKLFVTIFSILYYLYSGFGASFEVVPLYYSLMYNVYFFVFLFFFYHTLYFRTAYYGEAKMDSLKQYANTFIFIYIFFSFLNAGFPDFNLRKLFIIEAPNIGLELADTIEFNQGPIKKILSYVLLILQPFYLISLIKFKTKPFKLFLFLFAPIYFYYTLGGYVARSYLLPYLAIYLFALYTYNVKLRAYIKYGFMIMIPFLVIFCVRFSEMRIGNDIDISLSFLDLFKILFFQETTYPILFSNIYVLDLSNMTIDFFLWVMTLPIPSFLKGSQFSLEVNYYFTELLTGKNKTSEGLSVFLPGNVTESYLIFGKYFFFLLPIFGGMVLGFLYRIISSSDYFTILKIYFIFMMLPLVTRAGLNSAIPVVINGFLFFYLFLKIKINDRPVFKL